MTTNLLTSQAFKVKGRLYTFTVLQLLQPDCARLNQQLQELTAMAPRFFKNTPLILDCNACATDLNLKSIYDCIRTFNLLPVGIQSNHLQHVAAAQAIGLVILNASPAYDKELDVAMIEQQPSLEPFKTKLHTTLVRSGQQVVSKDGDLIITASVSSGAELLADGNIHVYGTLRGRALAGISGNRQARIFCQSLDAELLSIAGFYRLREAIVPHPGPCQIFLNDEHLQLAALC